MAHSHILGLEAISLTSNTSGENITMLLCTGEADVANPFEL